MKPGYVKFKERQWSYAGDRGTWAKVSTDGKRLFVYYARRGTVSSAYHEEFERFCVEHGFDFDDVTKRSGRVFVVDIDDDIEGS